MNRTQIYLPKTQLGALRRIAQKKKTSISEVIRLILREKLERKKTQSFPENLLEFAKKINLKGKKAPRDLAEKHNKYLYGK